jgi:hypothetical protein
MGACAGGQAEDDLRRSLNVQRRASIARRCVGYVRRAVITARDDYLNQ